MDVGCEPILEAAETNAEVTQSTGGGSMVVFHVEKRCRLVLSFVLAGNRQPYCEPTLNFSCHFN
jgi:hypothetical protein